MARFGTTPFRPSLPASPSFAMAITAVPALLMISFLFSVSSSSAQRHGEISSQPCPYSCKSQGIPKADCRDWREGDTCYIEDLRRPTSGNIAPGPRGSSRNAGRPSTPMRNGGWDAGTGSGNAPSDLRMPTPEEQGSSNDPWSGGFGAGVGECERLRSGEVPPPRVNIARVRSGSAFLGERINVTGSVEGFCLTDAGYYENGQKVETIHVRAQRRFRRYEFDVRSRVGGQGEIRVYNTAGDRDIVEIRPPGQYGYGQQPSWRRSGQGQGGYDERGGSNSGWDRGTEDPRRQNDQGWGW